jgi:hypothetical protein
MLALMSIASRWLAPWKGSGNAGRRMKAGQLPDDLRAGLTAEHVEFLEEGLRGSVTRRNYRAPRQYAKWSKNATWGSIAITDRRLLVWAERFKHIDVPHDHPVRAGIKVTADRPDRVCFAYDAGATNTSVSGQVEVRLATSQAAHVADLLRRLAEHD